MVSFSLLIVLVLLWRKQIIEGKEHELVVLEKELGIKRRAFDTLTSDLNTQRKRKELLENEAERAYQRAMRLKDSLEKLKEAFFFVDSSEGTIAQAKLKQLGQVAVRPPGQPAAAVIEEIENLLPDLTNNAKILRSQAEVLQSYCSQLESRQAEMQQILERTKAAGRPPSAAQPGTYRSPIVPEKTAN